MSHPLHVCAEQAAAVQAGDGAQLMGVRHSDNLRVSLGEMLVEVRLRVLVLLAHPADVGPAGVLLPVVSPGPRQTEQLEASVGVAVAALEPLLLPRVADIEVLQQRSLLLQLLSALRANNRPRLVSVLSRAVAPQLLRCGENLATHSAGQTARDQHLRGHFL